MKIEVGKKYKCMSENLRIERGQVVIVTEVLDKDDIVEFSVNDTDKVFGLVLSDFGYYFREEKE